MDWSSIRLPCSGGCGKRVEPGMFYKSEEDERAYLAIPQIRKKYEHIIEKVCMDCISACVGKKFCHECYALVPPSDIKGDNMCHGCFAPEGEREGDIEFILNKDCKACGKARPEVNTKVCSSCKNTYYCSKECQKNDRPNHKEFCKSQARAHQRLAEQLVCKDCDDPKTRKDFSRTQMAKTRENRRCKMCVEVLSKTTAALT